MAVTVVIPSRASTPRYFSQEIESWRSCFPLTHQGQHHKYIHLHNCISIILTSIRESDDFVNINVFGMLFELIAEECRVLITHDYELEAQNSPFWGWN
jgi:hypothetical protein